MAAKATTGGKNGEKISVKVKKKTPAENPETKKAQDTTEEVEQSRVSKQAPTLQPSREYLDKQSRNEEEHQEAKSEDDEPQQEGASVPLSTMEHSASKLTPSKEAKEESHDEEEKNKQKESADEVDEYGQKTLTVADYAQQPPQGLAGEDERDYKLSKSRLKRPPKGHRRTPAALLSALLLLVLCAIVAVGVYFLSQHSL